MLLFGETSSITNKESYGLDMTIHTQVAYDLVANFFSCRCWNKAMAKKRTPFTLVFQLRFPRRFGPACNCSRLNTNLCLWWPNPCQCLLFNFFLYSCDLMIAFGYCSSPLFVLHCLALFLVMFCLCFSRHIVETQTCILSYSFVFLLKPSASFVQRPPTKLLKKKNSPGK